MKKTLASAILALLLGLSSAGLAEAVNEQARAVPESLHSVLLSCMKDADTLGFEGRFERVLANLDETFDLAFMARMSVGSAWKELDDGQRTDFLALQRQLSASNYASNFDGYGGERFETLSDEPAARGTVLVKTRLVQSDGETVDFDYRLRRVKNRWRIIDVQLDGKVSEITLRRAEYRATIDRKGFPVLVEQIEEKIEKLRND